MRIETVVVIILAVFAYIFYRQAQQAQATVIAQEHAYLQAQQLKQNDPWLTVPGAVGNGLASAKGIFNQFSNLFSSSPSTTSSWSF